MTKKEAKAFINSLVSLRTSATDPQAIDAPAVYPSWKKDMEYIAGERILYNGILYKVITAHTSQADWTPDATASLFAKVLIPDGNVIPKWEQPDSTNPYMTGDKVTYNGKTYVSIVDNNVWTPDTYGWKYV